MSADLVARLRAGPPHHPQYDADLRAEWYREICAKAADEIERLHRICFALGYPGSGSIPKLPPEPKFGP